MPKQTPSQKAAATRRRNERDATKLLEENARLKGKLSAFNKLLKEGWAPKRKD